MKLKKPYTRNIAAVCFTSVARLWTVG